MIAQSDADGSLRTALQIVEAVHQRYPRMEISQVRVLLRILLKPGIRAAELIQLTGLSKAALSRAVRVLGSAAYIDDGNGTEKKGLGLITQIDDPDDGRAKLLAPTRMGRSLIDDIDKIVGATHGATTG